MVYVYFSFDLSVELRHLLDIKTESECPESQNVHQRASLTLDNFWWRVGQGSHIQQAPHPPGKHVWGEALILDSLNLQVGAEIMLTRLKQIYGYSIFLTVNFSLQGSFNRPHLESSSQCPSLSVDSRLNGLQVELSETCALCLSRLMSLIFATPITVPEPLDEASGSPTHDDAVQLTSTSQLHLLFKVDCCLEDVNVFTLSNLAGKSFLNFE